MHAPVLILFSAVWLRTSMRELHVVLNWQTSCIFVHGMYMYDWSGFLHELP